MKKCPLTFHLLLLTFYRLYAKLPGVATRTSPKTSRRPWQVVRLFFALLVIAGTVFLGAQVLSRYFAISEVQLPTLVGSNVDEAQQTLENLGLTARTIPSPVSDAPANTVISQSPGAGFMVREGRSITLEVSTPTTVAVPSLVGSSDEEARNVLAQLALELGGVTYDFSNDVREGLVISQNPPPGTDVPVPSEISISVSRGPNVPTVSMPDLRGQNIDAAKNRLRSLGFTSVDTVPSSVSNDAPQTVTQQSPAPREDITVSTRVTLGYSLSSQIVRQVPNLMGQSLANAQVTLQNAGLVIGVVNFIQDPAQAGGVVQYKPSRYTLANSPIEITFNGYEAIPSQQPLLTPSQPNESAQTVPQGPPNQAQTLPNATSTAPSTDGSSDYPFTFDPNQYQITQLVEQDYNLRVKVEDDQGERDLLNQRVRAGQSVTASLKVYGDASFQMYVNDILFMAW